ncbi:glucan endo-1,3-beta-glucosidase 12 [Silene latifolia]|uniref:glucan endo-1,3-beta-glucosidase 12 n=1 Tax=Silene latifolia TaxID=37657 RepID=UPI003D779AA9
MSLSSTYFSLLLLPFITLSLLAPAASTTVGATLYHRPISNVSPDQLAAVLRLHKLTTVHLLEPDPNIIRTFTYSPISLLLTVPNSLIPSFASNQSNAAAWLYTHVIPFYPRANITAISVGSDVTSSRQDVTDSLLPAIRNLHLSLRQLGIRRISVSTTFSLITALTTVFPPSAAEFQEPLYDVVILPLLNFLEESNSFFLINLYPYTTYSDIAHEIPLGFALFQESPFNYRDDPTTGVRYRNLFDVMVDAVLAAIAVAGHENIPIIVAETGWPSSPGPNASIGEDSDANPMFAELYLSGLVKHLKSGQGTPLKKDGVYEVYAFELFDPEVNVSQESYAQTERQWGIFYPNLTAKYNIDFSDGNKLIRPTRSRVFLWLLIAVFLMLGSF